MLWSGVACIRHGLVGITIIQCRCAHEARHVVVGIIVHGPPWSLTGWSGSNGIEIISKVRNALPAEHAEKTTLFRGEFFWWRSTEPCKVLTEEVLNSSQT